MKTRAPGPLTIVVGAGNQQFRSYGLRSIGERFSVALLDERPPAWAMTYAAVSRAVDLHDHEAVFAATRELGYRHEIAGVMTYMEHHVHLAARLAEHLHTPGSPSESVAAARDKHATRTLLAAATVPSARSLLVASEDAAARNAAELGYPVVLKPRSMGGSAGVRRADSEAEVREAFRAARFARALGLEATGEPGVLLEEYLHGPEISVECVVLGPGDVHVVAVTHKQLGPEPVFEEVGHVVDATDPLTSDPRIHQVATAALDAVGITHGVMHLEMRLIDGINPHIIEINARLGGDLIPHLVYLATGVNLPIVAAALASGQRVRALDLQHTRAGTAAVRFIYPSSSGRVVRLTLPSFYTSWLDTCTATAHPGDEVSAPPHATILDRLAHVVVTGDSPDICHDRLSLTIRNIDVTIAPTRGQACVA